MGMMKHIGRLFKDFFGYAAQHKAYWIIPSVIILFIITLVIIGSSAIAPFIYTLF
jgi:uncharacterized protein YdaL